MAGYESSLQASQSDERVRRAGSAVWTDLPDSAITQEISMPSFVARPIATVPPSGIRRFFDIAATMKEVISLGIGEPDFVTPAPVLQAGIDSLCNGETHYTSNSGLQELREALSLHLQNLYGVHYQPEDEILMTVGVSEALYLALTAVLNPGEEVIVPQPCFVAYVPEVIFAGGVPIPVETRVEDSFQVTAEAIERRLSPRTKAVLLGYPSNPTGAVMERETLEQIARLAEEHDLLVISDEIYDRLVYGWLPWRACASAPSRWEAFPRTTP